MSQTPNPMSPRTAIVGAVIGSAAIALFLLLWFGLGSIGVEVFPRLVTALCLPPALMAIGAGVYLLFLRRG